MDQLKVALAWLKTHHFWVLLLLATGIGFGVWYTAAADVAKQTEGNKKKISQEFSSAQRIGARNYHPNQKIVEAQQEENKLLVAKVRKTWQELYDRQVNEVLNWPEQLGPDFVDKVSTLPFGADIYDQDRTTYLNYIKDTFPELPKIVGALETTAQATGGRSGRGGRGGGGREFGGAELGGAEFGGRGARSTNRGGEEEQAEEDYIVQWHDQLAIKEQLTWDSTPSSLAIWVTQEDLWVYRTLLGAIARTNQAAGADRYSNAAVRDIYQLQVGKEIERKSSVGARIYVPEGAGSGGRSGGRGDDAFMRGDELGAGEATGRSDYSGRGRGSELGEGASDSGNLELLAGRYVSADGRPIAQPTDGKFKFGEEYKRLPVRLVMRLDQRWLSRLIIELANAPLQVEVEEVRINAEGEAGSSGGRRARRGGGSDTGVQTFDSEPHVRDPVVIEGVVYIFYPPDEKVLKVPDDGSGFAAN